MIRWSLVVLALAGTASTACSGTKTDGTDASMMPTVMRPWDWASVIGTGQSLAVGDHGSPVASTTQPYGNLKLSLGGAVVPPFDPDQPALALAPLVEPLRGTAISYPSAYPANLYGETPHTAMANQITALAVQAGSADYVTVHSAVGESGQPMSVINKTAVAMGSTGRAYAASLFEARAIRRLADAAGKSYGVGAVIITHGEADAGSGTYASQLFQLQTDYNQDLQAITGQTARIPLLVSQQNAVPVGARSVSASAAQQWRAAVDHPGDIVCIGPKYQYSYATDSARIHLAAPEYQRLGEKYGQVYFERVVLGRDWQPLQPVATERNGNVLSVRFHVPVPPLFWDDTLPPPHGAAFPEWAQGRGFEVMVASVPATITSVEIAGDTVRITIAEEPGTLAVTVGYAMTAGGVARPGGTFRWGQLRDSDPFVGATTRMPQPNYAVAFTLPIP